VIIKGGSRGGPDQLAKHLQRRDTNENVQIMEVLWPAPDLAETFRDWQTISEGTRGEKGLYHVNIDPAEQYKMTKEQWQRCVEVLEKELGFDGQPRVVVMHEKHGREHIHVVWARTDLDTMTLRSDGNNYLAHERASKALELEFGHEPVPGKHAKRDRKKQKDFPRAEYDHAEWQQGERTGIDPKERKEQITALRQASDSAHAFKAALEEQGYILAKGDRGYVIVDEYGGLYNLSRQVTDMKPAAVREFLKPIDLENLPTVAQAEETQQQRHEEKKAEAEKAKAQATEKSQPVEEHKGLSPDEIRGYAEALADRERVDTAKIRDRQRSEYLHRQRTLDENTRDFMAQVFSDQEAAREEFEQKNARPEGVGRIIDTVRRWLNPAEARARDEAVDRRRQELEEAQRKEREEQSAKLAKTRDKSLRGLAAGHARELANHADRSRNELERYIREAEDARRLLAEIKERERQRAEELKRDGPDPPKRAL
jgi:hypothetical protein